MTINYNNSLIQVQGYSEHPFYSFGCWFVTPLSSTYTGGGFLHVEKEQFLKLLKIES